MLRHLANNENAQVLATIGITFIIADFAVAVWGGDPHSLAPPPALQSSIAIAGFTFPLYRIAIIAAALAIAVLL